MTGGGGDDDDSDNDGDDDNGAAGGHVWLMRSGEFHFGLGHCVNFLYECSFSLYEALMCI